MPWCPRCGTGISEMELNEGYQDRTHRSVYLTFPLEDDPEGASLLVWTTTPWTLAANVAAAVHPELTYVKVRQDGKVFWLARDALPHGSGVHIHGGLLLARVNLHSTNDTSREVETKDGRTARRQGPA